MPDATQISFADGLDSAGKHDIGFKMESQLFEKNRQRYQHADPQGIVQNSRSGYGVRLDGVIVIDVLFKKGIDGPPRK